MDIRVPRLGEGAESGTVVSVLVKEGDKIGKDQILIELENEKAVAPIPSSHAGTVSKVYVKVGDKVSVGQSIISLTESGAGAVSGAVAMQAPESKAPQSSSVAPAEYVYESKSGFPPPASPSIRKMAQEIGLDLAKVKGSEHGGRITLEDIKAYVHSLQRTAFTAKEMPASSFKAAPAQESIDFSKWGPVSKKPFSSLRQKISQKMTESWTTIPHVTQFDEADITALMALRKKYTAKYEKKGANLTLTSFVLKAVVGALKKFQVFNASLDEKTQELVYKEYYHLGIAVDTEQGLIVPVLRDVDKKKLLDLSKELAALAEKTRQRKVSLEELKGGTFTISNLGGIGGTYFTPIINKPEVAILGVGRGVLRPVYKKEKAAPSLMLPLALSYDHRVIDGAAGARFIRAVAEALENFSEKDVKI